MHFPNLSAAKAVVLDTETMGPDWRRDKPVGYVVTWGYGPDETAYYPTAHASNNVENPDAVRSFLRDLLGRTDLRVIGHNLIFDLHAALKDNIAIRGPLECTMVNMALIDEHRHSYALDTVAQYYGAPRKKVDIYQYIIDRFNLKLKKERTAIGHFWKLPGNDPQAQEYARNDGTATLHVHAQQQRDLDNDELRTVWGVECRLIRVLFNMERRGVRVDLDRLAAVKIEIQRMLEEARRVMPKDFNTKSHAQVEAYLRSQGITSGWPTTEKGNPSFVESWLLESEAGARIITVRRLENLLASFIGPLENEHIVDGRVHTDFNQLRQDEFGTISGRLSSSNPNLQQVPKRNEPLAKLFRSIFLPEPGHTWGSCDYNQAEFRIFADYSEAQTLIEGYSRVPPVDIHSYIASSLRVDRYPAKRLNLGMLYGMGVVKLARSLKVSLDTARSYRSDYDRFLPEARIFLKSAEFWGRKRGWVRTKLQRRARFPDLNTAHKAGSRIIQGTNADIIKLKNVEVAEYLESEGAESVPTLSVHDELTFSIAPGEHKLFNRCTEIMTDFSPGQMIEFKVPMTLDVHTGRTWAEATFPEKGQ